MVEVRLEDITKVFSTPSGEEVAVDNLTFTIEDGEFFSLLGPSGCGKTTTLRMIAGLETPTSGTIYFDDVDVTGLSPQERNISMVFQDITLFPHMTTFENIGYGLKVRGETEGYREKVENIAELLDISELLDKSPTQLSGGQRQRVSLGRALVREPNIILFDEPLSDLDAKLKRELRVEIQRMHREFGTTMLYVTHDQEEAMTMSDRIGVMNRGVLEQISDPVDLFQSPNSEFVGQFIGEPTMNVLDATVGEDNLLTVEGQEEGASIDLESRLSELDRIASLDGRVRVGFRPSDIRLTDRTDDAFLDATLEMIEPIGNTYILYLEDDTGREIVAVSDRMPDAAEGSAVTIAVPDKFHVFDVDTGETLIEYEQQRVAEPSIRDESMA